MTNNKQEKIFFYLINEIFDFSLLTNVWIFSYELVGHESTRIKHMHCFVMNIYFKCLKIDEDRIKVSITNL
jgi:hypothetical protein